MYKTELHCHSNEISSCAVASVKDAAERYMANGYKTLVLTNHYSDHSKFIWEFDKPRERAECYFAPYELAREASDGRLNIIMGMELRVKNSPNDYLVYGVTPDMLIDIESYGYSLIDMSASEAIRRLRECGALVYQAHPFRNGMQMTSPDTLDGIEVYNGGLRHASRNDIAELWAEKYRLLGISGSDFHRIGDEARGGIITENEIKTNDDLLSVLKNRKYDLIKTEGGFLYE